MADTKIADLYRTQQSLTEWLQDIHHKDAEAIRREDNEKRERLKVLHRVIGLPFDQPVQFEASDISNNTSQFQKYLTEHEDELCALRLIPKEDGLPKLRMRGKSVREAVEWYAEQNIDPKKYRADFVPHAEYTEWSTIFVVNQHGIQGEIIHGGHHQLTQGFYESTPPIVFSYDFSTWSITPRDKAALAYLEDLTPLLKVTSAEKQEKLSTELNATFSHDYLEGYFETKTTEAPAGTWFIDYSPSLGQLYSKGLVQAGAQTGTDLGVVVSGQVGCVGQATGPVCIVNPDDIDQANFPEGGILVCEVTTPAYVPLMQKAAAIVTDQGGILSHAAIVARELKKPCIVATINATEVLTDGQTIHVDADKGFVVASTS